MPIKKLEDVQRLFLCGESSRENQKVASTTRMQQEERDSSSLTKPQKRRRTSDGSGPPSPSRGSVASSPSVQVPL